MVKNIVKHYLYVDVHSFFSLLGSIYYIANPKLNMDKSNILLNLFFYLVYFYLI